MSFFANPVHVVGGGAAAQENFSELWMPPETAHTEDDEFDGDALSGWSRTYTVSASAIDPTAAFSSGDPREDLKRGWLRVQPPADNAFHWIYKQFSGGGNLPDGTYFTRVAFDHRFASVSSAHFLRFALTEGEPTGAISPYVSGICATNASFRGHSLRGEMHDGSYQDWATLDLQGEGLPPTMYIAILRKDPDHYVFFGDGASWIYMGPAGSSMEPGGNQAYVAFGFRSASTNAPGCPIYAVDYFRYRSDFVLP